MTIQKAIGDLVKTNEFSTFFHDCYFSGGKLTNMEVSEFTGIQDNLNNYFYIRELSTAKPDFKTSACKFGYVSQELRLVAVYYNATPKTVADWLARRIDASYDWITIEEIHTDYDYIWSDEMPNIDTKRISKGAVVAIDFSVKYQINKTVADNPCDFENCINVPVCSDATVNINSTLFGTISSGGVLNIGVEDTTGSEVGELIDGVWVVPSAGCLDVIYQNSDETFQVSIAQDETPYTSPDIDIDVNDSNEGSVPSNKDVNIDIVDTDDNPITPDSVSVNSVDAGVDITLSIAGSCELAQSYLQSITDDNTKFFMFEFDAQIPTDASNLKNGTFSVSCDANGLVYVGSRYVNVDTVYQVWDWHTKTLLDTVDTGFNNDILSCLQSNSDGTKIAVGVFGENNAKLFDETGTQIWSTNTGDDEYMGAVFLDSDAYVLFVTRRFGWKLLRVSDGVLIDSGAIVEQVTGAHLYNGVVYMTQSAGQKVVRLDVSNPLSITQLSSIDCSALVASNPVLEDDVDFQFVYVDAEFSFVRTSVGALIFFENNTFAAISHIESILGYNNNIVFGGQIHRLTDTCHARFICANTGNNNGVSRGLEVIHQIRSL